MCIIAHTAKKKYMPRANVEECMKSNPSGFFMCELLPDGRRNSIRTMSRDDALRFFDRAGADSGFVLHARIPSYGSTGVDNVHGWEEDGIMFCHNMSLHVLDSMIKEDKWSGTDSEFFFRQVFMPLFRAFGDEAYKDGAFHPYIDRMVRFFAGSSNRFLFIMPDNTVIKYGNGWVKDFGGNCEFSNSSYRIVTGFGYGSLCERDEDDYAAWYGSAIEASSSGGDGILLMKETDGHELLRMALRNLVLFNVRDTRTIVADADKPDGYLTLLEDAVDSVMPTAFTRDSYEKARDLVELLSSPDVDYIKYSDALQGYAAEIEKAYKKAINRRYSLYDSDVKDILETVDEGCAAVESLLNVGFNFEADRAKDFAVVYTMERTKKGGIKPVRMDLADIICSDDMTLETATAGIECALVTMAGETEEPAVKKEEKVTA